MLIPDSATISDDRQEVTNKFLHTVIQYHLGELVFCWRNIIRLLKRNSRKIVKANLDMRFQELKSRVDPARWQQEYDAIFNEDWQIKGLMRMRLDNVYTKYIYINLKNPLRDV